MLSLFAYFSDYHEGSIDKSDDKQIETNFSFPGTRITTKSEDKQMLRFDFPTSATNSPFLDKRSSKQTNHSTKDNIVTPCLVRGRTNLG